MTPDAPRSRPADHPAAPMDVDAQAACVAACVRAATVCTVCVDGCLDEPVAGVRGAVRLALDCADVLTATASVLSRHFDSATSAARHLVAACITATSACADELEQGDPPEHRRRCAEECRRSEQACRALFATL
jgi:hypothetical protein